MRLPDFLIIGFQKCGTGAAVRNLSLHPEIHVGPSHWVPGIAGDGPEVHFFDRDEDWARGAQWYASQFHTTKRLLGEKTVDYIYTHAAHQRMRDTVPHARLIVFLRNPIDRAYSHWNHWRQANPETTPDEFLEAIALQPEFVCTGHYARHLHHLLRFFPRERLHFEVAERCRADMAASYARIYRFLGVDPTFTGDYEPDHVRQYAAPMSPGVRARLRDYFAPHNAALFDLLGYDIPEWNEPAP